MAGAALALVGAFGLADAALAKNRRPSASPKKPQALDFGELPPGPLQLVVSIGKQHVTLYSGGVRVVQGGVSTGMPGHPTPTGLFTILEKDLYHHSNLYSGAPMPFMQRVTWSGIALHEGSLPGHPASHGCIRMSHDFATNLWPITQLGVRVVIERNDVVPLEFSHPKLFVPVAAPGEPLIGDNGAGRRAAAGGLIRVAQAETETISDAAADAAAEAETAAAPETVAPGETATPPAVAVAPAPTAPESTGTIPMLPAAAMLPPEEPVAAPAASVAAGTPAAAPSVAAPVVAAPGAPVAVPAAPAAVAIAAPEAMPVEAKPVEATPVVTAPVLNPPMFVTMPAKSGKPAKVARRGRPQMQAAKHADVAVMISRKDKKLYVRQGFLPLFEMPIEIDHAERPIGTHVYTALEIRNPGAPARWNVMSITGDDPNAASPKATRKKGQRAQRVPDEAASPAPSTVAATEALDRVQIPPEAVERISALLTVGSSLIITDYGLVNSETGRGTDFIVLTH